MQDHHKEDMGALRFGSMVATCHIKYEDICKHGKMYVRVRVCICKSMCTQVDASFYNEDMQLVFHARISLSTTVMHEKHITIALFLRI